MKFVKSVLDPSAAEGCLKTMDRNTFCGEAFLHIAFSWGSRREKYAGGIFLGGIANGSEHNH